MCFHFFSFFCPLVKTIEENNGRIQFVVNVKRLLPKHYLGQSILMR